MPEPVARRTGPLDTPPATSITDYEHKVTRRRLTLAASFAVPLAVGIALRLVGIIHQSLWLDEAYSVFLAAHPFPAILGFVASSDAHPPLYYLLLHVWMILGPSELALRLLSALASNGALIPMFLLSCRLAGQRVASLATALLALSAFQVWYAQEVRMYALTTLAVLVAVAALARAWQEGGAGNWIFFTGATLTALYLDYSAFYVYSALIIWFVLVDGLHAHQRVPFILSGLAVFIGYLPWLPALWQQIHQLGGLTAWIAGANGSGLSGVFTDLFFNRTNLLQPDTGIIATLASALSLALVAAALWLPRRAPAYPLLAVWLGWPCTLGIAAEILGHPMVIARNIMVIQPALFLLLAMAAEAIWQPRWGSPRTPVRLAIPAVLLGILIVANISAQATGWSTTLKEDWRGAAQLVASHEQGGDLVLFNAYFTQMPFDYYFHQLLHGAGMSSDGALPWPREPVMERGYQTEESLLYANLAQTVQGMPSGPAMSGYARVWLILSHTGTTSESAVPPWLKSHYSLVQQWSFVGITVELYHSPSA